LFVCDDITWTDHSGADKIINKWNEVGTNVKWVHITSHGIDHVPYKKFPEHVTVTNSKGAFGFLLLLLFFFCLHSKTCSTYGYTSR
jgi:hypothetical protein